MKGSQEPRIKIEPKRAHTDGGDALSLMVEYGYKLDTWQQNIIDCWLGKDKNGKYNVTSAGLAVPRQNGKNVCLEAREFFGLVINGEKILHTAHQVKTSKKSFRRLAGLFTNKKYPEITDLVKNIRYTNGEESIELLNGGAIEFSARSRQAARGFDGISLVVYDEAQELTDGQVEAIMATLSASATGSRQIIYTGTPPYPNCPGTVFRRRRNICLTDPGEFDAWHEWSVEGKSIKDIETGDISLWYLTNPAMGIRLSEDFTLEENKTMSPDGFARERLGWWSPIYEATDNKAIDKEKWIKCSSKELKPDGKTAYGVKFSTDGTKVALCGAVTDGDFTRISLIRYENTSKGIRWLSEWLNKRVETASCVVIDGKNGVDVLIERIADTWRFKDSVIRANSKIVIGAYSLICDGINEQTLTWYELQEELSVSALNSIKRPIAGGYGFGGDDSEPIQACSLALWGVKNSKRNPKKKMRIG